MKYVTGLHCIKCGREYEADPERYLCDDCEDGILDVDYDYQQIKAEWSKKSSRTIQISASGALSRCCL
ncbi:MAG: hypothetical protein ACLFUK_02590 [Halanaerobium sp.]